MWKPTTLYFSEADFIPGLDRYDHSIKLCITNITATISVTIDNTH